MTHVKLLIAALIAALAGSAAAAAQYSFSFAVGFRLDAYGIITTSDVLNNVGGYDVQSITGYVLGKPIDGLVANPNQPNPAAFSLKTKMAGNGVTSPDFYFDNVLYTGNVNHVDKYGILGSAGGGLYFDICGNCGVGVDTLYYESGLTDDAFSSDSGVFAIGLIGGGFDSTPEPASWMMFVLGFGAAGVALRARQRGGVAIPLGAAG